MGKKILSPTEISKHIIETSESKVNLTTLNTLLLAIMAGLYVGFGGFSYILIGQTMVNIDIGLMKFLGAIVFPVGLMFITFTGSELFTGDALMTMGVMDKRISLIKMLRTWTLVYIGNLIGSVMLAFVLFKSGMITEPVRNLAFSISADKLSISFSSAIMRGILCNILVVLGVWFSHAATDVGSKIWAIWFPIMLFALTGFEHCIANMFFLPLARFAGLEFSWLNMWTNNIIPVTIGNIIGGGIIFPLVYYTVYIKPLKQK